MAYLLFDNDEPGFERWRTMHANAVVLNSSPGRLDPKYLKAHRPLCESFGTEARTTIYSKHCFDSVAEAMEYLSVRGIKAPTFGCRRCKVAMLLPTYDPMELSRRATALMTSSIPSAPPGNSAPKRMQNTGLGAGNESFPYPINTRYI